MLATYAQPACTCARVPFVARKIQAPSISARIPKPVWNIPRIDGCNALRRPNDQAQQPGARRDVIPRNDFMAPGLRRRFVRRYHSPLGVTAPATTTFAHDRTASRTRPDQRHTLPFPGNAATDAAARGL